MGLLFKNNRKMLLDKPVDKPIIYRTNGYVKIDLGNFPKIMTSDNYETEAVFLDPTHVLMPEHLILSNYLVYARAKEIIKLLKITKENKENFMEKTLLKIEEELKSIDDYFAEQRKIELEKKE